MSAVMTGSPAPVEVRTTSADSSASRSWSMPSARPLIRSASARPRSGDRFTTMTSSTPAPCSATAIPFAHRTRTDERDPPSGHAAVVFDGHLDRSVAHRGGAAGDAGLGAGTFADADGMPEQQVERGPGTALALRDLPGLPQLTEDLRLADDGRVETCRDLEQVADRRVVVLRSTGAGAARRVRCRRGRRGSRGCRRTRRGTSRRRRRSRFGCRCSARRLHERCRAVPDPRPPWGPRSERS